MSDLSEALHNLKVVLDETLKFPAAYLFKFIVPSSELHQIVLVLEGMEIEEKASQNGKYISVSAKSIMNSSSEIITIYQRASKIKGIISL